MVPPWFCQTVANPLDYKKVITERSFAKDWKPKYPLYPHQRGVVFEIWYMFSYECTSQFVKLCILGLFVFLRDLLGVVTAIDNTKDKSLVFACTRYHNYNFENWPRTPQIPTTKAISITWSNQLPLSLGPINSLWVNPPLGFPKLKSRFEACCQHAVQLCLLKSNYASGLGRAMDVQTASSTSLALLVAKRPSCPSHSPSAMVAKRWPSGGQAVAKRWPSGGQGW
eukprot:SAG22_NODE_4_length_44774_cov_362.122149_52_plen_225_part_00